MLLAILAAVHWYQAQPLVEGPAPPLAGPTTAAPTIAGENWGDLATPADGPRLVHFWATWCPICKLEEGSIAALSRRHDVVTVAMQSGSAAEIEEYLDDRGLDLRTIADPNGEIAARWGVKAVPASFIIDRDGRIRYRMAGYTTGIGLRIRLWLTQVGW